MSQSNSGEWRVMSSARVSICFGVTSFIVAFSLGAPYTFFYFKPLILFIFLKGEGLALQGQEC